MERVRAHVGKGSAFARPLLRQVAHDINGPLFAFTLDLDLASEAMVALKAALDAGDVSRARAVIESTEEALRNLQAANASAAEYVRDLQALAEETHGDGDEDRR